MAEDFKSFVGIDVSETALEVCVLPQATRRRFSQDGAGWQALCEVVAGAHRRLEAGGLEGKLVLCPDLPSRRDRVPPQREPGPTSVHATPAT